jgi:hypothetical protein
MRDYLHESVIESGDDVEDHADTIQDAVDKMATSEA